MVNKFQNDVSKYIIQNYHGKLITTEDAKSYCRFFNFHGVYKDDVLTMTEGYIDEQDLLGIYVFDENDFPDRMYKEIPSNQTPTKMLLFVESRDNKTITNLFIHNVFFVNQSLVSKMFNSIREKFK